MKTWYYLVTASLALVLGCGGGFRGSLPQSYPQQSRAMSGTDALVTKGSGKFDVPVQVNKQVKSYLVYFSTKRKKVIQRHLARSKQYLPMIRGIFREYGLPEDLAYLAMIESGFNPNARSPAGAYGMWQFIKSTGRRYGLVINKYVDERRDPVKSTRAAAKYLRDLYKRFGSWYLAAASYNCGEGRIQRELNKGGNHNFWDLSGNKCLPTETKNYVPQMIAAIIIAKNPEKFGFNNLPAHRPQNQDNFRVTEPSRPSRNPARMRTAAIVPQLRPKARRRPLASKQSGHQLRAPKSRSQAKAYAKSSKKRRPSLAKAKSRHNSAPYTASLFGSSRAATHHKSIKRKKARSQPRRAGIKRRKPTRVKAGKGKKPRSHLLARKSRTKKIKAHSRKKKIYSSHRKKRKRAKPRSRALLAARAR